MKPCLILTLTADFPTFWILFGNDIFQECRVLFVFAKQLPAERAFLDIFNDTSSLLWGFGITDLPEMSPGLLLISVIVQARTSPWRTKFANVVELLLTAFLMVRPGRHIQ